MRMNLRRGSRGVWDLGTRTVLHKALVAGGREAARRFPRRTRPRRGQRGDRDSGVSHRLLTPMQFQATHRD